MTKRTPSQRPTCTVPGCEQQARSASASLCPKHYHRWYRHGDVNKTAHAPGVPTASPGRRYRTLYRPSHPLAMANGKVYAHRMALYDEIGPGTHRCHWCDRPIHWGTRGEPGALHPDHLNGQGDDNRPENLVPACAGCNTGRGSQARARVLRANGWWSKNDTIAALTKGGRRTAIEHEGVFEPRSA